MKTRFLLLSVLVGLATAGCQNDAPIADSNKRNASGEVEGKEPTFVMVPSQKDPNYKGK